MKQEAKHDAKAAPVNEEPPVKAEPVEKASSPTAKENKAPEAETSRLHVGHLTRNVQAEHIHEVFSTYGTVKHVELAMDKAVNLPRGFAYVEFSKRSEAEEAQKLMDGGQLDGNQLSVAFVLVPRKPKSPPRQKPSARPLSPVGRRESDLKDARDRGFRGRDGRDTPRDHDYRNRRMSPPRRRSSPMKDARDYRRRPLSPPRSRRPISPRGRLPRSPPRRRVASPPRERQRRRTPTRRSPARRRTRSPAGKGRTAAPQPAQRPVRGRSHSSSSSGSFSSRSSSGSYSSDSSRS